MRELQALTLQNLSAYLGEIIIMKDNTLRHLSVTLQSGNQ